MFGLTQSDIDYIQQVLHQYAEVEKVVIYGSRAMGNYKPGSDVDIALMGNVSLTTVMDIAAKLNECNCLPYKFDIVGYNMISHQPLLDHIHQYGVCFYTR